jgi:putative FmdB family regulatory protein
VPLYEYQCARCGRFEQIQKFSDPPLGACPACGGEVQKLLSAPSFQFKGSGWYVTDYARKPAGGDGKDAAPPSSSSPTSAQGSAKGPSPGTPSNHSSKDSAATGSPTK